MVKHSISFQFLQILKELAKIFTFAVVTAKSVVAA